jgi:hypothetical protein
MQRLVDTAVMIIAMIVLPLGFEVLQKAGHLLPLFSESPQRLSLRI